MFRSYLPAAVLRMGISVKVSAVTTIKVTSWVGWARLRSGLLYVSIATVVRTSIGTQNYWVQQSEPRVQNVSPRTGISVNIT